MNNSNTSGYYKVVDDTAKGGNPTLIRKSTLIENFKSLYEDKKYRSTFLAIMIVIICIVIILLFVIMYLAIRTIPKKEEVNNNIIGPGGIKRNPENEKMGPGGINPNVNPNRENEKMGPGGTNPNPIPVVDKTEDEKKEENKKKFKEDIKKKIDSLIHKK